MMRWIKTTQFNSKTQTFIPRANLNIENIERMLMFGESTKILEWLTKGINHLLSFGDHISALYKTN